MIIKLEHIKWESGAVGHLTDRVVILGHKIDPSTDLKKRAYISRDKALADVMDSDEYLELTKKWLKCEIECCDARDKVNKLLRARVYDLIEALKRG